jgi:preprotein translocase subunit SecG
MPEHALLTLIFSFFFFLLAMHLINKRRKQPKKSADFASSPLSKRD